MWILFLGGCSLENKKVVRRAGGYLDICLKLYCVAWKSAFVNKCQGSKWVKFIYIEVKWEVTKCFTGEKTEVYVETSAVKCQVKKKLRKQESLTRFSMRQQQQKQKSQVSLNQSYYSYVQAVGKKVNQRSDCKCLTEALLVRYVQDAWIFIHLSRCDCSCALHTGTNTRHHYGKMKSLNNLQLIQINK